MELNEEFAAACARWRLLLAAAITALGGVFWLVRDRDRRAEAANEP